MCASFKHLGVLEISTELCFVHKESILKANNGYEIVGLTYGSLVGWQKRHTPAGVSNFFK